MVPFVNLKGRQQYQHTRYPTTYSQLLIAYRLLVLVLIFHLMNYIFSSCVQGKRTEVQEQAKPADAWIADYGDTEEECLPHLLVCQILKNPTQLLL